MSYPTSQVLVAASDVDALQAAPDEKIDRWRSAAIRAVERFCGQKFEPTVGTRIEHGNSAKLLPLTKRLALLTGIALNAELATSLAVTDVAINEEHNALYVLPDATAGGTWATRVMREGRPALFPYGYGTVEITGTWGWTDAEMPPDMDNFVNQAVLLEMEDLALADQNGMAKTVRSLSKIGLRNVVDGRLTAVTSPPDVVLSPAAQNLVEEFVWQPAGVAA